MYSRNRIWILSFFREESQSTRPDPLSSNNFSLEKNWGRSGIWRFGYVQYVHHYTVPWMSYSNSTVAGEVSSSCACRAIVMSMRSRLMCVSASTRLNSRRSSVFRNLVLHTIFRHCAVHYPPKTPRPFRNSRFHSKLLYCRTSPGEHRACRERAMLLYLGYRYGHHYEGVGGHSHTFHKWDE